MSSEVPLPKNLENRLSLIRARVLGRGERAEASLRDQAGASKLSPEAQEVLLKNSAIIDALNFFLTTSPSEKDTP